MLQKPVVLNVEWRKRLDGYGQVKSGFEISVKLIERFWIKLESLTEAGGLVKSDDVKLVLQVQMD